MRTATVLEYDGAIYSIDGEQGLFVISKAIRLPDGDLLVAGMRQVRARNILVVCKLIKRGQFNTFDEVGEEYGD
jgi:hypothetical protein